MTISNVINHLERVKKTGMGRWIACCPSHEDKHPSLNIRELEDGRILMRCMAGCDIYSVLSAISLEITDLFPAKNKSYKRERKPFPATDILMALVNETLVVLLAGHQTLKEPLSDIDKDRLTLAVARIQAALDTAGVNYA